MKKILVHNVVDDDILAQLNNLTGLETTVIETHDEEDWQLPSECLADKNILFCCLPPTNFASMEALEFIQISSVGYSQLYGLRLPERNIRACNARGVFDVPIAEWNIAMMVNLARDVGAMARNQQSRVWERHSRFENELRGKVLGIWGYGGIGRETARLAKMMGMKVRVLARSPRTKRTELYCVTGVGDPEGTLPDQWFTESEKGEFLSELDFLILAMPLTPQTEGIMTEADFNTLPNRAFVLNPARGPLIVEEALLNALRQGNIAGAALDTHYYYPLPADHPLWLFPNVILTPHISGSTFGPNFKSRIWDIFFQNVQRLLAAQPLLNELSKKELCPA